MHRLKWQSIHPLGTDFRFIRPGDINRNGPEKQTVEINNNIQGCPLLAWLLVGFTLKISTVYS